MGPLSHLWKKQCSLAAHEFLVLHYYALDSWDEVLLHVVPTVRLPGAKARRAAALEAFGASHIPPLAPQNASRLMDGCYDSDLEPADWW